MALVGAEITFQFVCGFSRERFYIGLFVSSYNLVLSTLQAFVALTLEHRNLNQPLQMMEPVKYRQRLEYSQNKKLAGLNDFWRWIWSGFWQGAFIAIVVLGSFLSAHEASDSGVSDQIMKPVGLKDSSTVAFNITLTVIFLKLSFELDKMSKAAIFVIIVTLILCYIIVAVFSNSGLAVTLDPDLLGVGSRSVFTLEQTVMLFGCCAVIAFTEYLIMYLRILRQICSGEGLPKR